MLRTLALAAALGALALPAAAASVTVNIAGLDAKAAHARIVHAAIAACSAELRDESPLIQYYQMSSCIDEAVADAEAKLTASEQP
jgi:hypothetical protein